MRTEIEALKEIRDRISYFCSRTDGKYDPPWAQEVIGIIDDALGTDGFTNSDYEEAKASGRHFVIQPRDEVVTVSNQLRRALELAMLYFSLSPEDGFRSYVKNGKIEMLHARNVLNAISSALAAISIQNTQE